MQNSASINSLIKYFLIDLDLVYLIDRLPILWLLYFKIDHNMSQEVFVHLMCNMIGVVGV